MADCSGCVQFNSCPGSGGIHHRYGGHQGIFTIIYFLEVKSPLTPSKSLAEQLRQACLSFKHDNIKKHINIRSSFCK